MARNRRHFTDEFKREAVRLTDALMMALHRRGRPREVLHHSDQGSQYTSEQFQMLLADAGIVCSMSKRGDCWDNAPMESFFSTLKTERLSRRIHRSRDECRADVFDYIERFYNARRQHSTLGYVSPMQFEAATSYVNQTVRRDEASPLPSFRTSAATRPAATP